MSRCLLAFAILVISTLSSRADTVCEDPAFIMEPESDLLRLHQIFNAGEASRRLFTEVHYFVQSDPHLTVGMGHWIDSHLATLFQKLRQDQDTWTELTNAWANTMTPDMWLGFEKDSGEKGRDSNAISRGLEQLVCATATSDKATSNKCVERELKPWSLATNDSFNSPNNWFHAGWQSVSVLRRVAEQQIQYWAESVVSAGQHEASKRGIVTLGGIASVISAESSGLGTTMFKPGSEVATASFQGTTFTWSLTTVPEAVRPSQGAVNEVALLEDWKSFVAWQYYTVKKGRVRSRMQAIWSAFYEPTWGPLPDNPNISALPKRRHSSCYMARGRFDTASADAAPTTLDCTAAVPLPRPAPCVTKP